MAANPQHKIIIITAPSGAGKTTITRHLLKKFPDQLSFSVSATTRPKRNHEKEGVDYYFMNVKEFKERIRRNAFVEWEEVYLGKFYGTLKKEIRRIWKENKIPLLDVDVSGALHVEQQQPEQTLTIFIEPPSVDELKKRLESRGTETSEGIHARVSKATYELSFSHRFDKKVINKNLEKACRDTEKIVRKYLKT
jgi:guanylate kinase